LFALPIDYQVLDYVITLNRKEGAAAREQMLRIRDFPGNLTDYFEIDSSNRQYCVHIFGQHAIKYWIDDADRVVKIMEIRQTDQD